MQDEVATSFSNDVLHLIVLPTEQCNFRCIYCYEDFSIGTMKPPVVTGLKRLIAERVPTLRRLHIAWFGGEPLLALNIVKDVSSLAKRLAAENRRVVYTGEMTTNAFRLDQATAENLYHLGIRQYQITLDGPQELHDRTRVRRNGAGSFQQIWANLIGMRASSLEFKVCLRIHVTPSNFPFMSEFLSRIRQEFLVDPRFTLLLKAVGRWGGPNDDKIEVFEGAERQLVLDQLTEQAVQGLNHDVIYQPGEVCYASRPNSLLVRASGEIGKCTVALSDPANNIGRLLEDGSLELRNEALQPWLRGWRGDPAALGCPLVGLPRESGEPVLLQIGARPATAGLTDAENSA